MAVVAVDALSLALLRQEQWLENMRAPSGGAPGYAGPVVHWWRDSLLYCGPGFDWRYEGIILGYLALHTRSGWRGWLDRAVRAGEDLVLAQLPSANFRHSGFELNPTTGGTPHEAAAAVGLLALAAELKSRDASGWSTFARAARSNLEEYYIAQLWDPEAGVFCDDRSRSSFVPNKAATLVEALCLLADVDGAEWYLAAYVRPTLEAILRHQVGSPTDPLEGGIAQSSSARTGLVEKYFPFYVARCIPALLEGARRFGDDRYLAAAIAAGAFLQRWRDSDGGFPQVVYPGGRVNRYPRWVGGVGDVLRALELLHDYGLHVDLEPTRQWLLRGQLEIGAFKSAEGFGSQVSQRTPRGLPDMRDVLPIVGWNDKAFRYLAGHADSVFEGVPGCTESVVRCAYRGATAELKLDRHGMELHQAGGPVIRWPTRATWADVA
jgi:hypothetical protein